MISDYDILANAEISEFNDIAVGPRVVVPEPGSMALFGLGVLSFGLVRRGRKTTPVAA